jgi:hypothetical protein
MTEAVRGEWDEVPSLPFCCGWGAEGKQPASSKASEFRRPVGIIPTVVERTC